MLGGQAGFEIPSELQVHQVGSFLGLEWVGDESPPTRRFTRGPVGPSCPPVPPPPLPWGLQCWGLQHPLQQQRRGSWEPRPRGGPTVALTGAGASPSPSLFLATVHLGGPSSWPPLTLSSTSESWQSPPLIVDPAAELTLPGPAAPLGFGSRLHLFGKDTTHSCLSVSLPEGPLVCLSA